jgi:hypothetical protein
MTSALLGRDASIELLTGRHLGMGQLALVQRGELPTFVSPTFAAEHASSYPNLAVDGSDFNVLGYSPQIRTSWALADDFLGSPGDPLPLALDCADEQLEGVQKLAVFFEGNQLSAAAVQTNRGTWLTVIDALLVEVKSLDQLKGGNIGELFALYAKPCVS